LLTKALVLNLVLLVVTEVGCQAKPSDKSETKGQATTSNDKQRQATTSNDKQRQPTTTNDKQRQPTTTNDKQRQPTFGWLR
jgi:hypothetical protein